MSKSKVSHLYKETKAERLERVRNEGRRFRSKIETLTTHYNRQKAKNEVRKLAEKGA